MNKLPLLLLLILLQTVSYGQFKVIAEGPEFKEPKEGFGKILQLKNGNTLFMRFFTEGNDDIQICIYGPDHKQLADRIFTPVYSDTKGSGVNTVCTLEQNGKICLYLSIR